MNTVSLLDALVKRFGQIQETDLTLSKSKASPPPRSRQCYATFLQQASKIFQRGYMNVKPLAELVIYKLPPEIRCELLSCAENNELWDNFIKRANEIAWLAFPDPALNAISYQQPRDTRRVRSPPQHQVSNANNLWCELHQSSNHDTGDCITLIKMRERQRSRFGKRKALRTLQAENDAEWWLQA